MGLIALLAACRETDDDVPRLCAAMPVGGRTLLEYQAYVARGAGADGFVVYAERATPELRHMIERLVHAGFRIKLAQSVLEMIDHIHPTDRLLMIADGVVASADIVERTIACPDEAIATIADIPANIAFERLDGKARWAGLAVLEGGRVAAIRSMPEDWDVQSTLLRSAVQIGTAQLPIDDMIAPAGDSVLDQVEDLEALADVDQRLLHRHRFEPGKGDWVERHLFGPLGRLVGPVLFRYGIAGTWLELGAIVFHLLAIGLFLQSRPILGLLLLLVAGPLHALGQMLGAIRGERSPIFQQAAATRAVLDVGVILALAWGLFAAGAGWGQLVLAAWVVQHGLYLIFIAPPAGSQTGWRAIWQPGGDIMTWAMIPFAFLGQWAWVLGLLAVWLTLVFADRMWRAPRQK